MYDRHTLSDYFTKIANLMNLAWVLLCEKNLQAIQLESKWKKGEKLSGLFEPQVVASNYMEKSKLLPL